jgi:hypothetical protein
MKKMIVDHKVSDIFMKYKSNYSSYNNIKSSKFNSASRKKWGWDNGKKIKIERTHKVLGHAK